MKICPNCGEKTDSKYCPECGMNLENVETLKCPACGSELEDGETFCPECGAKVELDDKTDQNDFDKEPSDDSSNSETELVAVNVDTESDVSDNSIENVSNTPITLAEEVAANPEETVSTMSVDEPNETVNAPIEKKKSKKKIWIIVGAVLLALIAIIGLGSGGSSGPKVDHYSINYMTPYDGDPTDNLDGWDLIAVYDNEEEKTIEKSEWYISNPSTFTAPSTEITIRHNGEDLYFEVDVNESEPEPEPEPEPVDPKSMTARDMMNSIESYLDGLISQDKCESYQESDNGKYIFISWPSGTKALVSGIVFNKYVNDEYVEIDSTDEIPASMNVRTTENMIQGETGWYVKGQNIHAMEYMMKAILPDTFGDDDGLYDELTEMQNEAGGQMTGDGSYAISEKEIGGYKVTLLLTQKDNALDSVFSIKF